MYEQRQLLEDMISFIDVVLKPLFGSFIDIPKLVYLTSNHVEVINTIAEGSRPGHRLHKSIEVKDSYALLLPDYCGQPRLGRTIRTNSRRFKLVGPVISTEIKPKQGFLPDLESLPSELAIKANVSRFCLKQYHKQRRGSVRGLSSYCPLDLFSGCERRMTIAIESLLDTPQNNFRLFKDLSLVYGEEQRPAFGNIFSDFIEMKSDSSYQHIADDLDETAIKAIYCNLLVKALLRPNIKSNTIFSCRDLDASCLTLEQFCDLHPNTDSIKKEQDISAGKECLFDEQCGFCGRKYKYHFM